MTNKFKNWTLIVLTLIVLTGIWLFGFYSYPVRHPCLQITSGTTFIHDTANHYIYAIWPWYYEKTDTIIAGAVPADVDTAAILQLYYSTFQYTRTLQDSNLFVTWQDNISQNKAMPVDRFMYELLKPQSVINNIDKSVTYSKYLYIGGSIPLPDAKYSDISLFYASRRSFFGLGYIPVVNGVRVSIGTRIAKFK